MTSSSPKTQDKLRTSDVGRPNKRSDNSLSARVANIEVLFGIIYAIYGLIENYLIVALNKTIIFLVGFLRQCCDFLLSVLMM